MNNGLDDILLGLFGAFQQYEDAYDASQEQGQPDMSNFDVIDLVQGEDGVWYMPAVIENV